MKHIIGFSGGIDSEAVALWVLNRYDKADVILCNSNAGGNEHPLTTEFIDLYSQTVHPVIHTDAIIADMWLTADFAATKNLDGSAALDWPTMIRLKGRPPSRRAQFCTEILKLRSKVRGLGT